jgi:methylmalonyl-CoA/ethylmalonyl-CoA epimerase
MAFFDCAGIRLMISAAEKSGESYSSIVYFKVPNMQDAWRELTTRGITVEREPHMIARLSDHELWLAFFRDPDRNLLALMCEVRNT